MTVRVLISGFVQGVGFRHFVKSNAQSLNIRGWIKNLPNGKVEAIFQGNEENIEHLIAICKKGPFLSEVEDIKVEKIKNSETFDKFETIT
ncbi:MAG: acylphosphatase [Patescibacteria group bacterium]